MTTDWAGLSLFIGSIGAATAAIIGAVATAYIKIVAEVKANRAETRQNMTEIKKNTVATYTVNGTPMGKLAEQGESRRISRIPPANRTEEEIMHLMQIPLPERPGRNAPTEEAQ